MDICIRLVDSFILIVARLRLSILNCAINKLQKLQHD